MPDRVDPMGGWFNLGDRAVDALPTVDDSSRITLPRSAEPTAMKPRAGTVNTLVIPANIFQPDDSSVGYAHKALGVYNALGPKPPLSSVPTSFLAPLYQAIPAGSKIYSVGMRSFMKTSADPTNLSVVMNLVSFDLTGTETNVFSFNSTSNNAAMNDEQLVSAAPNPALATILDGVSYYLKAQFTMTGYAFQDAVLYLGKVKYIVPG